MRHVHSSCYTACTLATQLIIQDTFVLAANTSVSKAYKKEPPFQSWQNEKPLHDQGPLGGQHMTALLHDLWRDHLGRRRHGHGQLRRAMPDALVHVVAPQRARLLQGDNT